MKIEKNVQVIPGSPEIVTQRLRLRPWAVEDANAALKIFGHRDVSRWLAPALNTITNRDEMRNLLEAWLSESPAIDMPLGRWAVELRESGELVGAASLLPLPPGRADLEIGWQIAPAHWGHGFGAEAGHAVAHQAFSTDVTEVFAVVRPRNNRGISTARRVGMEWVGETDKYYGLTLQVYRLAKADLDISTPGDAETAGPTESFNTQAL
ncbi:GNAT family N-acetyltransferase [Gordonia sp. SL306]|uniref:GNAT family N-acetyltransferase n=1 Tax=Gordonia sp. SL306 TaxID=2995145 RepID=UPI00226FE9D0|nr:GNAT family N-acetyltransferase [Gordonia sp. SL306]WAC55546.1 GNAT family N-acetyltransferase [Gordonia sp. SL306]